MEIYGNGLLMNNKVLIIGLDGFETTLAERLIGLGKMPNLKRLIAGAARVELDHGAAKRTGLAWEHFSTGLTPDGANRWAAVDFDPNHYTCVQKPTQLPPFTAKFDFKTVVFDAPYFDLDQASAARGYVAWGAHDPGVPESARPASLSDEILQNFGEYPAKPWIYGFTWPSVERTRIMGESLAAATRLRGEIAQWLLSDRLPDWSLGIVVISELHSAIEALWHGVDESCFLHGIPSTEPARVALEQVYEAVDEVLGNLHESFPNCLQVMFSMHGMGPNSADVPAMALLPEFLFRRHYKKAQMQFDANSDAVLQMCNEPDLSWSNYLRKCWIGDLSPKKPVMTRVAGKIRSIAASATGKSGSLPLNWMPASWYTRYWKEMPAFAIPAFYDGQIRINVAGREKHGVISQNAYDASCALLAEELSACVDPATGESAVEDIVFTHPGKPLDVGNTEADLIVVWKGSPMSLQTPENGQIGPLPPRRPGGHTGGYGISLWLGGGVQAGTFPVRSAFDVVPTVVEYLTGTTTNKVDGQSFLDTLVIKSAKTGTA